jgi:hypothetical protein
LLHGGWGVRKLKITVRRWASLPDARYTGPLPLPPHPTVSRVVRSLRLRDKAFSLFPSYSFFRFRFSFYNQKLFHFSFPHLIYLGQIRYGYSPAMQISDCKFHKYWCSENHTLLRSTNNISPCFIHVSHTRHNRCPPESRRVCEKLRSGNRT